MEEAFEVITGEAPLEWLSDCLVVILEVEDSLGDVFAGVEVVGCEGLSLEHGEVDLDLIQPAGVHGQVHEDEFGPLGVEPVHSTLAAVDRAVVDDPEDSLRRSVGFGAHDRSDQGIKAVDRRSFDDVAKEACPMDIPGRLVRTGAAAAVLVLEAKRLARARRPTRMASLADLQARLLIGGEDEIPLLEGFVFPPAVVQIQDSAGLVGEIGIAREDPAPVAPRSNRVLRQPAPDGRARDLGDDALLEDMATQLAAAEPRQRKSLRGGQLAGQRFDFSDDRRGGNRRGGLRGIDPLIPRVVDRRSVFATSRSWAA